MLAPEADSSIASQPAPARVTLSFLIGLIVFLGHTEVPEGTLGWGGGGGADADVEMMYRAAAMLGGKYTLKTLEMVQNK